mmetsp:Transcript_18821/g.38188  ORF Transcript_18821/g.38188 Transcript_18821/m.38188 type:complete len:122 (-) Transcript_18821:644-1009(-)
MKCAALSMHATIVQVAKANAVVDRAPAHGKRGLPSSSKRVAMYKKLPPSVIGKTRRMTGSVPNRIGIKSSPMMPQRTEVGQSGPPIKMHTFAMLIPGVASTSLIVRMTAVLIPTSFLTDTN